MRALRLFLFPMLLCVCLSLKAQDLKVGTLSTDSPLVHGSGGQDHVNVSSKEAWDAEAVFKKGGAEWLLVEKDGKGLTLRTESNKTLEDRTALVIIHSGEEADTLSVIQRQDIFHRRKALEGDYTISQTFNHQNNYWIRIAAALPVPQSGMYQDITDLDTGKDSVKVSRPSLSRYIARFYDKDFPKSGTVILRERFHAVTYQVTTDLGRITAIVPYDTESDVYKTYTKRSGDHVVPEDPRIQSLSQRLWKEAGASPLVYARLCYLYVAEHFKYQDPYTSLHTLDRILKEQGGDCGNLSSVFVSLMRAQKIPARHLVMLVKERQYHIRAEFYLAAYGWIPVDVTYKQTYPRMDFLGRTFGQEIIVSHDINLPLEIESGRTDTAVLLQTQFTRYAYRGKKGFISFVHSFQKEP